MNRFRFVACSVLAMSFAVGGCTPTEDWADPEYIQYRMEMSDPRAFNEFSHLTDEQKATLVPTLVEVFNSGLNQEEVLRALVASADPRGKDVFLSALSRSDDRLAGLAARGLAAIQDTGSATAVAERLATVTQHDAYAAFLDALNAIPTPQAADVVANVMMRPAERVGGINTIRRGCAMLGQVESPSEEVIDAMVFGTVNLIPQPFEDALNECELALLAHGDAVVPKLAALFRGENQTANTRLTSMQYQMVVGKLRAGAVLAHIGSPLAVNVLISWFNTQQEIPVTELERMTPEQAAAWYDFHGQLFTAATQGLAYAGTDDATATLRGLESTGEGQLLEHFRIWFQLSAGAEFGLRTAVHEGMMKAGVAEDRELLWTRAESGALATARTAYFTNEFRKNALHYVGRTALPTELERYQAAAAAQTNPIEFLMHMSYFVLAQTCGDDVACYAAKINDPDSLLTEPALVAALEGVEDEQARGQIRTGMSQNARTGAVWQLGVRLGDQPAAAVALLDALSSPSMQVRFEAVEALHFVDALPADAATRLETFLTEEAGSTAQGARELRHAVRVLRAMRL